jgi:acyl carrier protein
MEELLPLVRTAFSSAFGIEPQSISIDTTPADIPAWDSMGHVTLASNLEHIFGLTFDVDELMEMENVKDICAVLQSKLGRVQGAKS